ncbi:AAA family ATPase [Paenibacillus tritici]|uniref:AAA family ATPase n=1 Tax=Paenibacillus tritici TaxID=1873425 RepID=UPI001FEA0302|nr:ATP-binding protein [Paenibacillus tritici]
MRESAAVEKCLQRAGTDKAPLVVLMCGVAGSGKTTFALKLEHEGFARLSIDEEIWSTHGRFGVDYPEADYESFKEQAEVKLRGELVRLIQAGRHVVVDFSFWQRRRRDEYKQLIGQHGGEWALIHLKVQPDELRQRLLLRNVRMDANAAFPITGEILTRFLNGFETPAGEGEWVIEADMT